MTNITTEQARTRFTSISPSLQDAVFSVQTAEIIGAVMKQNNVSEEKSAGIAEVVGLVFLGFMHPEELAQEIASRTGIPLPVAKAVSDSLANRIFNALRSDLDKTYAPALHPHEMPEPPPMSFGDIKRPSTPPLPPSAPSDGSIRSPLSSIMTPRVGTPPAPAFTPRAMNTPFFSSGANRVEPPPLSSRPIPTMPAQISAPTSTLKPIPTPMDSEPTPMMLHEEVVMKPIRPPSSFNLNISSLPKTLDAKPKEAAPVKPAFLELGSSPAQVPEGSMGGQAKVPRVVHYTELRTPLPQTTTPQTPSADFPRPGSGQAGQAGTREIHEITAIPSAPPIKPAPAPSAPTVAQPLKPQTLSSPVRMNDVAPRIVPQPYAGPTRTEPPTLRKDFTAPPPPPPPPPPPIGGPLRPPTPPRV
jgi:hypothetical protein